MKTKFLETICCIDGEIQNISWHQERYENVLSSFDKQVHKQLLDSLDPPSKGLYRCRLVYSLLDDTISVSYHPYEKRLIKSLKIIENNTLKYDKKYENRKDINTLFLLKEDCDDILIVKNEYITDTSIANVAFYDGKRWLTPREPLLKGTTRKRYLQEGKIIEADIKITQLSSYTQIALLNAMIDFDIITNIRYQY